MTAPRAAIVADAMERLSAVNAGGENELMPSGDPITFPAFHVFDPGHRTDISEPGATRYALDLEVEGYIAAGSGATAHAEMIDLYTRAVAAMLADPPLGGVAETVDEGDFNIVVASLSDQRRLGFNLIFSITFPANRGNPALSA